MASKQTYSSGSEKENKKEPEEEKCSQDKGEVCFHDVGGGRANAKSLASLSVSFKKVLK